MKKSILAASLFTICWTQTNFGMFNYVRQMARRNMLAQQRQLCSQASQQKRDQEILKELHAIEIRQKYKPGKLLKSFLWMIPTATLGITLNNRNRLDAIQKHLEGLDNDKNA